MWLPERGSLHTVVLFTPGKWAARWICLTGLLIWSGPSQPASGGGVAAGGGGQPEQPAQGRCLVGLAERATALQFRHQAPGDRRQVVADGAGAQPEAGQAA